MASYYGVSRFIAALVAFLKCKKSKI